MIRVGLLVTLGSVLIGCSSLERPSAKVVDVKLTGQTNEGARVQCSVYLRNPNDTPLPLTETQYTIFISDIGSFEFTDVLAATLPPRGHQTIKLAASFVTDGQDLAGRTCHTSGRVYYSPPGEIRKNLTDAKYPLPWASFSSSVQIEGIVDLEESAK